MVKLYLKIMAVVGVVGVGALALFGFLFTDPFIQASLFDSSYKKEFLLTAIKRTSTLSLRQGYFAQVEPPGQVSLVAVGDLMLSRTVSDKIKKHNDPHYPFLEVADFLKGADITFGNLENPITDGPRIVAYQMQLRADPGIEWALEENGFDILSLANNHLPDFGDQGIKDTLNALNATGIEHTGAGMNLAEAREPAYVGRNELVFAFLAYNDTDVVPERYEAAENRPGTAIMNLDFLEEDVKKAKQNADFVIVSMHSGKEYVQLPNGSQTDFAHRAIDAGAELVVGHHPHVVQTMEQYNGKYIFYSLGNFVFDQMQSLDTRRGLAVKLYFDKKGVQGVEFYPVQSEDYSQAHWVDKATENAIVERLNYPVEEDERVWFSY